jgi:hypothetical protein
MKKIALFSAVIVFAQLASASQIISTRIYQNQDGSKYTSVTSGFSEDGFGLADETCFLESSLGVCPLIDQAQGYADEQYGNGGHGTFNVKSCIAEKDVVKVSYTRINDYDGEIDVLLNIKRCTEKR